MEQMEHYTALISIDTDRRLVPRNCAQCTDSASSNIIMYYLIYPLFQENLSCKPEYYTKKIFMNQKE